MVSPSGGPFVLKENIQAVVFSVCYVKWSFSINFKKVFVNMLSEFVSAFSLYFHVTHTHENQRGFRAFIMKNAGVCELLK